LFEIRMKLAFPIQYERELFKLSDGGTIALDWYKDEVGWGSKINNHEGGIPKENDKRPILACVAGLSGGNDNGYLYSMIKKATSHGFKCVIVNFRGASGVKMTSPMFYGAALWEDFKEPVDYIHSKYCKKQGVNLYGFGVSLGAAMVNLYLVNEGAQAKLNGAILYC
jgi:predicted alpha/beta-fold hydrolase